MVIRLSLALADDLLFITNDRLNRSKTAHNGNNYRTGESRMIKMLITQALLFALGASPALAVIGGGDLHLPAKDGDVLFSHDAHVAGAGLKCQQCHPTPFTNPKQHKAVTMKAMETGKSCGACHDGKTAFSVKDDCAKCHKQ